MDPNIIGETAAIATSCLWTTTSLLMASAGKRIGALSVNAYRIVMAVGLLLVAHVVFLGTILPVASSGQWFWMGISGIVGLAVGDGSLYAAYLMIGPRRAVLVMALAPIFASLGAYLLLGEVIPAFAMIGIAVTLGGIVMVILEREDRSGECPISESLKRYGVFFALIGAAGQGVGLVLAKKGINLNPEVILNPLSATLMRMIIGTLSLWIVLVIAGKSPELRKAIKMKDGLTNTLAGAFLGSFLGITFSMVAVTYTHAGVAQTLMSLSPVLIIPTVWILYRQRTSWRGILGAAVAVIGVSILLLT